MKSPGSITSKKLITEMAKGLRSGVIEVKRGTVIVRRKTRDLSEEGKRQYRLIALKTKVLRELSALGARVYSMVSVKDKKNLALDSKVKDITAHIRWFEAEINSLEKKQRKAVKRRVKKAA